MKKNLYCAYDKVSHIWAPLWPSVNDETAKRDLLGIQFGPGVRAADIELYSVGEWDDLSGHISGFAPQLISFGGDFS